MFATQHGAEKRRKEKRVPNSLIQNQFERQKWYCFKIDLNLNNDIFKIQGRKV